MKKVHMPLNFILYMYILFHIWMWLWLGIWKLCLLIKWKMNNFFRIQWICLFVWCLFMLFDNLSLKWRPLPVKNYALHSWQLSSEGSLDATPTAERLALPVFTTLVCYGWDSKTLLSACDANSFIQWNIREEQHMMKTVLPVYYADHKLVMDKKHETP